MVPVPVVGDEVEVDLGGGWAFLRCSSVMCRLGVDTVPEGDAAKLG